MKSPVDKRKKENTYVCMTCGKQVELDQEFCECGHDDIGWYPTKLMERSNVFDGK